MHAIGNFITSPVGETHTVPKHSPCLLAPSNDELYGAGELVYLRASAAMVRGSWVTFEMDNGNATLLAANAIGPVAVSLGVVPANSWAWFQRSGKAVGLVAAGFVDNGIPYATATAGTVDDAAVAGDRVKNARGASAIGTPAAGLAEFELDRPFMDDGLAD